MNNMIQQALGGLQSATPTANATNQLMGMAGQFFDRGANQLVDTFNKVGELKKQAAINQLINDVDVSDPYAAQSALFSGLSKIPGVNAMDALGLSAAATKSALDKQKYQDALTSKAIDQQIEYLKATKSSPKGYGMISDDLGNFYAYNKDTGDYTLVQSAGNSVSPKNVELKAVTSRDDSGREVTRYIPINKMTGQALNSDGVVAGTKAPTISKDDKEFRDSIGTMNQQLQQLDQMVSQKGTGDSPYFGWADNLLGWGANTLGMNTEPGKRIADVNALTSNLLAGFGKAQMAGVLTDQDMEIIRNQIPDSSDSEIQARTKINFIKNFWNEKLQSYLNRMRETNPGFVEGIKVGSAPSLNKNKSEGSPYGDGTEIIKF